MSILEAIFLGIVQGVTEFLPISSSGHLILAAEILGIESSLSFVVWLHAGTLVAVCLYYRKTLYYFAVHPKDKRLLYLAIASLPTFIIAALFKLFVPDSFFRAMLPAGFTITIILLLLSDRYGRGGLVTEEMGVRRALITGAAQGVAVISGLSRSGATIFALTAQGIERGKSGEFSFLLSIPVIVAGGIVEAYSAFKGGGLNEGILPIFLGALTAAAVGFFAIKLMLRLIASRSMKYLAFYLLVPLLLSVLLIG